MGGQFAGNMANGMLAGLNDSGSADSVTKAAVSEGTIVIRDKEKQTQDVADLSRDVANANPGLDVIFDKEKEQNRLKAAQLIGEIGAQAGKNAVENNNLAVLRQGAILAAEGCTKIAACRNALIEKGLGSLLGIGTAVTVLDKLSDTDKSTYWVLLRPGVPI